jgi:hypothetical protein
LPWEQQVCETLGISEKDYFNYYDLVSQHVQEEKGRELIPDVRNEPVTIVTLVVGLALSAVGALLAPKPRSPEQKKQGAAYQGQDIRGRTKYAPLAEFDSVQELATLGTIVPLIFTKREGNNGGVRAESQMLWSRMINKPTYQELQAILLFSAGELDDEPSYEGFAFGDSKISSYMSAKLALFFARGESEKGNEPFAVGSSTQRKGGTKDIGKKGTKPFNTDMPSDGYGNVMHFCGTVTPSQSAVFGQYSPIRNGHGWKYAFKYPGKGDGDSGKKEQIMGTRRKHVAGYHAGRTTLEKRGNSSDELEYYIKDKDSDKIFQACDDDAIDPNRATEDHFNSDGKLREESKVENDDSNLEEIGGLNEGISAINQSKIDADTVLDVGELYLIGTRIYRCTDRKNSSGTQGTPYEPNQSGSVTYDLDNEEEFEKNYVSTKYIYVDDDEDVYNEKHIPIQKVAVGAISTTRAVDMVELGVKSIVYRQINGYPNISEFTYKGIANDFAKNLQTWQPGTITAYYDRVSLFRLEIKKGDDDWKDLTGEEVFAVHGQNPQPLYNTIQVRLPSKDFYEFRFIPVCGNAWIANGNYKSKDVFWLNSRFDWREAKDTKGYEIRFRGKKLEVKDIAKMDHPYWATGEKDKPNQNPNSLLNDYWYFDADTTSHSDEPEHKLTFVNEYVINDSKWYKDEDKQYEYLARAGLICQSSKEISTFSNFSGYFEEGIKVKRFVGSKSYGATNLFPEIAYNLLTNRRYGVGEFIGNNAISTSRFKIAARFCDANDFYWDGVISEPGNVREFLYQQAAYQMLDFTILGGEFSLYPALPFNTDFKIDYDANAGDKNFPIKALFTDANVRNYKTTFLSPEERQLFIAELKYRREEVNGFPETRVTRVRLADDEGGYSRDPVELFDMTQFCTSRTHAIRFAKYALRTRQTVDHSITFETTPDAAHNLAPGDYIRVAVSIQHQVKENGFNERLRTGSVTPDGAIQINSGDYKGDLSFKVIYWRPGFDQVKTGTMQVKDGVVQNVSMRGSLFTRVSSKSEARVYKIESIAYSEDSFVEISGSYTPLTPTGRLKVLDWTDKEFVIEDQN